MSEDEHSSSLVNICDRLPDFTMGFTYVLFYDAVCTESRVITQNTTLLVRYMHLPPTGFCKTKDKRSFRTPQGLSSIWGSGNRANFQFPTDKVGEEQ